MSGDPVGGSVELEVRDNVVVHVDVAVHVGSGGAGSGSVEFGGNSFLFIPLNVCEILRFKSLREGFVFKRGGSSRVGDASFVVVISGVRCLVLICREANSWARSFCQGSRLPCR